MRMTKIRLNGLTVVDLPIQGAKPTDEYISKNWDGLGPPEVDVFIASTLNAGGVYQGRRPQGREPVGLIGLNPDHGADQTASELRETLYGLLTPGYIDYITIQIVDDEEVVCETPGYVRRLEINPFSKDPEVQITLACTDWYFTAPDELFIEPDGLDSFTIANQGSAPAGFRMELTFSADLSGWTLSDPSGKKMQFDVEFLAGDLLTVDTRPGHRGIWVTRSAVTTNVIYALSPDSIWYMLHGGDNLFTTSDVSFAWGDFFYRPQFWGI